ncbi:MAG: hypothetical protein RIR39_1814 [Pseudomonadota bacterium]
MNVKQRLIKLESSLPDKIEPLKLSVFFVNPGDLHTIGYTCEGGIVIMRKPDESEDTFKKRCSGSVTWPDDANSIQLFKPIYSGD